MKVKDISKYLEEIAPLSYQESYDNSGLLIGDFDAEVSGILISLDVTEAVIKEAISKGFNLIVAHHPLIFKGVKSITGKHWVERCIQLAIKNDISIYAIHTNLDNINTGVNEQICNTLGLKDIEILVPKSGTLMKLTTFVPSENKSELLAALHQAGAGNIGNYDYCSFSTEGEGAFRPNENSNPTIGEKSAHTAVKEIRIEVLVQKPQLNKVLTALVKSHPYEEVAYYVSELQNNNQEVGSGMIGNLKNAVTPDNFLKFLKQKMNAQGIKYTNICFDEITRVAVCGGAGSFLLKDAIKRGAQIFISSDFKYHDYFEADNKIIIADIGHYESEQFTKELLYGILSEKFANIAIRLTEVVTNPINYL
ncbi:MAG: Nif3-like dinuclear metal center hexameric protein [Cyclobacteriaceae bacterium]